MTLPEAEKSNKTLMNIFSKIFLAILPILVVSLLGAIGIHYSFSSQALRGIAENWLQIHRDAIRETVREQNAFLHEYDLDTVSPSLKKAHQDALTMIKDTEVGGRGFAFVVDAAKRIRGHPDLDLNGVSAAETGWFRHMREQPQGGVFIEWEGMSVYALYTYFKPWQWHLLVAIPKAELYRPIQQSQTLVVSVGVAGALGLALILWLVTHRLVRPLRDLSANIEEIGKEGPGRAIAVKSQDEIGKLGQIFNEMSYRLSVLMKELRQNEQHFRWLIEKSSDMIFVLDQVGTITYAGPSVSRILGYAQEDMLGQQVFGYIHTDDQPKLRKQFRLFSGQSKPIELIECRFRHAGEYWKPFEINSSIPSESNTSGIIINARDVTERNRMEQSRLAADAANKAKSELIAQVSHDIRTPLDAILGLLRLIRQDSTHSARQQEYCDRMQQSARTLLGVIDDLLDYARIEEGKLRLERNVFLLEEVVDHVLGLFAMQAAEKDLELMAMFSEAVPGTLLGDALRLEQVLINLISNAFKFTDEGQVVLTVEVYGMKDNLVELRFAVKDTGMGVPRDKQEDLFLPFIQAEPSTMRVAGGTGLGLAICRRLVNMMQGDIWVESRNARGASFVFTACFSPAAEHAAEPETDGQAGLVRKALIVHSNADFQTMMRLNLKRCTCDARSACSLEEALEIVQADAMAGEPCQVVFLDHRLCIDHGRKPAELIREAAGGSTPTIVSMLPFGSGGQASINPVCGGDRMLFKPVCLGHLRSLLHSLEHNGEDADSVRSREIQEGAEKRTDLHGVRVLLAEDNPVNQFVQKEILESLGLDVELADNGRQALSSLQRERPDLILMDIQMPELDGLSASRAIRAESRFQDLPIIAMTAYRMEGEREKCLEAGINEVMPKPMQPEQLLSCIARWIAPSGQRHAPGEASAQAGGHESPEGFEPEAGASLQTVDIRRGLQRLNGKQHLFDRSLRLFVTNYASGSVRVHDLLRRERLEEAARYCHTMKGAAATICADRLHEAICDLEAELKRQQGLADDSLLEAFDAELDRLVHWIQETIEAEPSTEETPPHA